MRRTIIISFTLVLVLPCRFSCHAQTRGINLRNSSSQERVALVIGNSNYQVAPLKNPVNDARDIARALGTMGFAVIYKENLTQNDMKRAIRSFGERMRNGGIGLFFYAGHGVQVKGVNYLVPVDAKVEREEEVEYECVDAGFVLAQMESARNSMNIVILDACRNNPFARGFRSASRGLAQMDAPSGTLIAYSTAPGSVASDGSASNGLYTQELLKFVQAPNVSIEEVFKRVRISVRELTQGKQTPWESSSLTGDFYFTGSASVKASSSAINTAVTTQPIPVVESPSSAANNSDSILGKYKDTKNSKGYLELKSDGTFFLSEVGYPSGRALQRVGKYEVEGNQITIKLEMGIAARGVVEKDKISFEDGSVYVRGNAETDSSSPTANSASNHDINVSMALFSLSPRENYPSRLMIGGTGWDGGSDIKVLVNGQDVSKHVDRQMAYSIALKGTAKELNIQDGKNTVVVVVNGVTSNKYEFKQATNRR